LAIAGPGQTATAGAAQTVTITLTDTFGNVITNYLGTLHFTSSDSKAGLPADYTFTTADQGKHSFQITLKTTGSQTLSVTDKNNSSLKASASIAVTTSAQVLAVAGLSPTATAGTAQSVTVTLTDIFGNVVTNYLGTIEFASSDAKADLPAE